MEQTMKTTIHQFGIKNTIKLLSFFIACCVPFFLSGCQAANTPITHTDLALNTVVSITLYGNPSEEVFTNCMDMIHHYEKLFSRTTEGSDIWNVNQANGEPIFVDPETISLLSTALSYAELSDGKVDPTIGTLSSLWNFGETNQGMIPSDNEIKEALSHVDYRKVLINGNTVQLKDPKAMLDLGFIAKGYIADRIKEYLLSEGVKSGIINLGGNVLTIGTKPDGSSYQVGIQKPFADAGTALLTEKVTDASLVSSGNYERYFEKDGILYHHILSTKTGYPAKSNLSEVTILSNNSVDGDALSTLLFILGSSEGNQFLTEHQIDAKAIFIDLEGNLIP